MIDGIGPAAAPGTARGDAGPAGSGELCAVVLAAGEGARLRPLTRLVPKPLCPVGGVPLVDHALDRVRPVTPAVAVNVHHGRALLEAHLRGRVHVSVEEEAGLGTAGALGVLRPWIDGRATVVLNGDTWSPGSLAPLLAGWDGERIRVLVVDDDRLRPTSRIAGALMPWSEVAPLAAAPSGLWEVSWGEAVAEDRVEAVTWSGPSLDCGTPARYLAANMVASGGAPVVAEGATVAGTVERAVLWDGAVVRPGERLVDAIRTDSLTVLVR